MTANDFRRMALALPETAENAHMDHPDFRVCGKIFATLGYPAKGWGMVKLTPEQQHYFTRRTIPTVFVPVKGAWGRRGATSCASQRRQTRTTLEESAFAQPGATRRQDDLLTIPDCH